MLPKLPRLFAGAAASAAGAAAEVVVLEAATGRPLLVVRRLFEQSGLWEIFDELWGRAHEVPAADRAFVLSAQRLLAPHREHGLARWLETDFVCERRRRRLVPPWKRRGRVQVAFRQRETW
jgi:hypothetical protein